MGNVIRGVSARSKVDTDELDNSLKSSDDDMAVVIQDYPSPEITEPTYKMGEKLRVIAEETYWWRVRSVQTRKENYIPSTHVAKVYHSWLFEGLERQKAEELLQLPGNRVGSFLIRENPREKGVYSLSVKHMIVKHYRIFRLDNSWYYISPRLTFQCLEDMINHYSDSADGLCCALTTPCLSTTTPSADPTSEAPPVLIRNKFDWKKVDRDELVSTNTCSDNMVSYGVRNSIAAYLSFSETQDVPQSRMRSKRNKSRSVYGVPQTALAKLDREDES